MYPNNQQPSQPQQTPPPQTPGGFGPQPGYTTPQPPAYPQPPVQPQPQFQPISQPTPDPGYGPQPSPTYAVDYLDQIAPPPPRAKFMNGGFGKAIIGLGILLVLGVSLIVALGGPKNRTADIENMAVRLENLQQVAKATQKNLKNSKLITTNSNYQIWLAGSNKEAADLVAQAGVKKSNTSKQMIASEKAASKALNDKFKEAKLNANLDRTYAREMAYQAQILMSVYKKMSKSEAKAIREYANKSASNLAPIQKSFADFDDSIN